MLQKFCDFIVEKRKWFIAVFLILTIVCAVLIFKVNINYDMTDYLPKDSITFEAMDTMFTEFGEGASASIMITDIDLNKVPDISNKMAKVKGVTSVLWLNSALEEMYPTIKSADEIKDIELNIDGTPKKLSAILNEMTKEEFSSKVLDILTGLSKNPTQTLIDIYPLIKDIQIEMLGVKKPISALYPTAEGFADYIVNHYEDLISAGIIPQNIVDMVKMMMGQFYSDRHALVQIFFEENAYSKKTVYAIDDLKKIVTDAGYHESLGGMAASAYAMETIMESELFKLVLIVAPIIIILLFLSTSSFFEPVVYLIIIGISVILNMGSNKMLPSVSYLTFSIAALIQVAVSMDYSIFIMHSYKKNRQDGMMPIEASKVALRKSLSSVSASSLTTIAGFVALMFMRYKIGMDIGGVLAKGILCSLITAFLFMPGFLVLCDKPIMKGEHKTIVQLIKIKIAKSKAKKAQANGENVDISKTIDNYMDEVLGADNVKPKTKAQKAGDNLLKLRYIVPLLFVILLAPAYLVQSDNQFMYGELASSGGDGSTLMIDRHDIEQVFGSQNNIVVMLKNEHIDKEKDIAEKLLNIDNVKTALSYEVIASQMGGATVPQFMTNQFVSDNYHLIVMTVSTGEEDDEAFKAVDDIGALLKTELPNGGYYLVGNSVVAQELKNINNKDYTITTSLALTFIFIILLLTFKGLVLPLILALLIQGSIWFAMTIPSLANTPLVFLGYLIVSCFQMGCTIDYGILFSNNYLHFRETNDKLTACKKAFKGSVGAISLSAAILMTVGYTVGIAGSIPATSNIGLLLGIGATVSYLAMTYLLPLFLVILDKPIRLTTIRFKKRVKKDKI